MKKSKKEDKGLSRSQRRRREDILRAAIKLFDRDGFDAAKISDIAEEAEIAKGTLYLYFETKIQLLEGVVEDIILPTVEAVGAAVDESQPKTAEEMLKKQIMITGKRMASPEMKTLLKLMIETVNKDPKISQIYYKKIVKKGLSLFKRTLDLGVKNGEFRSEASKINSLVIVGSNVYLAVWNNLFAGLSPKESEKLINTQIDIILQGLRRS